jgi:hypothetical protein
VTVPVEIDAVAVGAIAVAVVRSLQARLEPHWLKAASLKA